MPPTQYANPYAGFPAQNFGPVPPHYGGPRPMPSYGHQGRPQFPAPSFGAPASERKPDDQPRDASLCISNLPQDIPDDLVHDLAQACEGESGDIVRYTRAVDDISGATKPYSYVTFGPAAASSRAFRLLDGLRLLPADDPDGDLVAPLGVRADAQTTSKVTNFGRRYGLPRLEEMPSQQQPAAGAASPSAGGKSNDDGAAAAGAAAVPASGASSDVGKQPDDSAGDGDQAAASSSPAKPSQSAPIAVPARRWYFSSDSRDRHACDVLRDQDTAARAAIAPAVARIAQWLRDSGVIDRAKAAKASEAAAAATQAPSLPATSASLADAVLQGVTAGALNASGGDGMVGSARLAAVDVPVTAFVASEIERFKAEQRAREEERRRDQSALLEREIEKKTAEALERRKAAEAGAGAKQQDAIAPAAPAPHGDASAHGSGSHASRDRDRHNDSAGAPRHYDNRDRDRDRDHDGRHNRRDYRSRSRERDDDGSRRRRASRSRSRDRDGRSRHGGSGSGSGSGNGSYGGGEMADTHRARIAALLQRQAGGGGSGGGQSGASHGRYREPRHDDRFRDDESDEEAAPSKAEKAQALPQPAAAQPAPAVAAPLALSSQAGGSTVRWSTLLAPGSASRTRVCSWLSEQLSRALGASDESLIAFVVDFLHDGESAYGNDASTQVGLLAGELGEVLEGDAAKLAEGLWQLATAMAAGAATA